MAIVTTMFSSSQNAHLSVAEVAALLPGSMAVAWNAAANASKEIALQDSYMDIQDLPISGERFLDAYEGFDAQPVNIPTTATNHYQYASAETGSTETAVIVSSLSLTAELTEAAGGVIVNIDEGVKGFRQVAVISYYDEDTHTFHLTGTGFDDVPHGEILIVWPYFQRVQKALAIQAYYRLLKINHRELAQTVAQGFTTTSAGTPGTQGELRRVAPYRQTWHEQALVWMTPYLDTVLRIGRA